MIIFDQNEPDVYQEGIVSDVFTGLTHIDPDKVKDDWQNSSDALSYGNTINDDIVGPVSTSIKNIDTKASAHTIDNRSIIARARNSVLQFPVYISQSVTVQAAHTISEMFNRVYTSYVQTTIAQNPVMNEEEANDLVFLKRFHTNIQESVESLVNEFYKPIDTIDEMMKESIFYSEQVSPNCTVEFRVTAFRDPDIIKENALLMNEPLAGFSYLQEETIKRNKKKDVETTTQDKENIVNDSDFRDMAANILGFSAADRELCAQSDSETGKAVRDEYSQRNQEPDKRRDRVAHKRWEVGMQNEVNKALNHKKGLVDQVNDKVDEIKDEIKSGQFDDDSYSYSNGRFVRTSTSKTVKTIQGKEPHVIMDAPHVLRETDIKKVNGAEPYKMEVSFRVKPTDGGGTYICKYIVGVKSVLHLIRVQDLADDLHDLITGNIRSLQKVRYKSGEISFKDYFLNIKQIKNDAMKSINYNKKWINTLKRLAEYNKMNGSLLKTPAAFLNKVNQGAVPIPNATLVITQADVTTLTNQTGIDLSEVSNAKRLASSLFLIAIVIVDPSAGSMRILFPANDVDWDVQSLAAMEAEIAKTDNSNLMRELNKIVNK